MTNQWNNCKQLVFVENTGFPENINNTILTENIKYFFYLKIGNTCEIDNGCVGEEKTERVLCPGAPAFVTTTTIKGLPPPPGGQHNANYDTVTKYKKR